MPDDIRELRYPAMGYNVGRDEFLMAFARGNDLIGAQLNSNGRAKYRTQDFRLVTIDLARASTPTRAALTYSEPRDEYLLTWPEQGSLAGWQDAIEDVAVAHQTFEHGEMIWRGDESLIYALFEDEAWESFDDTFQEGQLETDPALQPPAGLLQPKRGFGKVWRQHDQLQNRLGWATAPESGDSARIRTFETGVTLTFSDGTVYIVRLGDPTSANQEGLWQLGDLAIENSHHLNTKVLNGDDGEPASNAFLLGDPKGPAGPTSENLFLPPASNQTGATLIYGPTQDEFFVVWADDEGETKNLKAIRLDADRKEPNTDPFTLFVRDGDQTEPSVVWSGDEGLYTLVWREEGSAGGAGDTAAGSDIWLQRLTPNGELRGPDFAIVSESGNQAEPSLGYNTTDGRHFVTWLSWEGQEDENIRGRRLNPNGRPFRRPVTVSWHQSAKIRPALAANPFDEFFVIWADSRDEGRLDLWGHRLNGNGIPFGPDFKVVDSWRDFIGQD